MKAISLAANERTLTKTTGSKKVRNSGRVPGVLYGEGDPQNIELESVQFEKAVKSTSAKNFLVELEMDGSKSMALVQDVQAPHHPPLHPCRFPTPDRRQRDHSQGAVDRHRHRRGRQDRWYFADAFPHHPLRANRPTFQRQSRDTSHLQVGEGILLEELSLTESVSVVGNPKACSRSGCLPYHGQGRRGEGRSRRRCRC